MPSLAILAKNFSVYSPTPLTDFVANTYKTILSFKEILPLSSVLFVDSYASPKPDIMVSGNNKASNFINAAEYFHPDADGHGITIGIKEKKMDGNDIDLQKNDSLYFKEIIVWVTI